MTYISENFFYNLCEKVLLFLEPDLFINFFQDIKKFYDFLRQLYLDYYALFFSLLQIEIVFLIKNPMHISAKRYPFYYTTPFILLVSYLILDYLCAYYEVEAVRLIFGFFFVLFSFIFSLCTIISLSKFINNTKTKIISVVLQIISIVLFYIQIVFDIYLKDIITSKSLNKIKFYFLFGLDGLLNIVIVITFFLIFIFFSSDKSFFSSHSIQRVSEDIEIGLLNRPTSEAPIFNFNILNYFLTKNFIVILEVIRTIAIETINNTIIKQINGNFYVKSNEFICNIDNNNNVSVNKKKKQEGLLIKLGSCCEFQLFSATQRFYKFSVIEHCPEIFQNIRLLDGITYDIINDSFNISDNLPNLSELCQSEGKSGSLFFFTHNKKFILKTIPEREFETFLDFASSYNNYLVEKKLSFLVKIYGLYTINNSLLTFHIILMENISPFPSHRISYKFDLKGSLYERETKDLMKNRKIKALKDNDFLEISKSVNEPLINISKENIQIILKTIQKDIQLLTKANLMDYSLYICIVNNSEDLELSDDKYIRSIDNKYIYCIGIIDYLTEYKMRKVLEKRVKNLIHFTKKKTVFSVIEPILYQSRLFNFIKTKIFI